MSSGANEENLMRMTKDELQRWIQSEVDRNPQLVQRHKQLAQVEEWVKEKEREATNTRLLYSNACESVLECESVMKGLYGMLGLEYRDEDSDEEGGGSKKPQDIIQITDDEEKEKTGCDNVNDIVVVDMGAAQETLEPMLEKVTVAMERSSKLVQDLVQMVTKASSNGPESSSVISSRPAQSSPLKENLELTDNSFAIIKTESLSTAVIPSEMSLFSNSHNTDFIKTEPPSEISSLQNNCNDPTTSVSHDRLSFALIKTESQSMDVTPAFSSPSRLEPTAGHDALLATIKTEPQYTPVMSDIFSLSNNTVKTEPQFMVVLSEMSSSLTTNSEQFEMSANQNSDSIATLQTEPQNIPGHSSDSKETTEQQLTSEMPSVLSNSEQHKTSNSASEATSEMSSPPSNSEQDDTLSNRKSPSPERQAAKRSKSCNSPVSTTSTKTRLRSSTTTSSITNTPSSQKETRSSSPVVSIDDPDDIEEPDRHDEPSVSSTNTSANKTTSVKVTNPSTPATKPAASAQFSNAKKVSTTPSTISPESSKTHKEVELKVDTVMLGKWKNMAWHRGTVVETQTTENGHRYNVEFKNGKNSLLPAHHVACMNPPMLKELFVGCRVVVGFKDEQEKICYRGAVLAELPDRKNRMRFLVFCDDGRAAYVALPDLHLVCKQLKKVWKDIEDEECRLHVKEYLSVYPNPISVLLRVGQDTKVERDGKFQPCTINQLDGSLIQICFKSDKQKEWLFRGSERLEHIVNIKKRLSQKKSPQSTTKSVSASTRVTRQSESTATTTLSAPNATSSQTGVAKASSVSPPNVTSTVSSSTDTTVSKTPSPSPQSATSAVTQQTNTTIVKISSAIPQNASSGVTRQTDTAVTKTPSISLENAMSAAFQPKVVLQKMDVTVSPLDATVHTVKSVTAVGVFNLRSAKRPALDEAEDHVSETKSRHLFHRCCPACVDGVRPKQVDMHHGQNPLQIPLLFNFRRMTARRRLDGNVFFHIFYRSPCGRSLCDLQEVQEYLFETHCDFLFLEMFCMDPFVLVNRARPPSTTTSKPYLYLPDISKGKEVLPLPCVNEVDRTPAPSVIYIKDRFLAPGISINTSLDFLTGCNCTDGCRDRTKCSCHRMTIEGTALCSDGPVDVTAGYMHKRLQTTLPTGVYECNALCRCNPRICCNRLVQHGLQLRLELFMTRHKGWGIRCKDDVAKGTFVCVFTGKIVTEDKVNEDDDMVSGNEYLANLDFIEGVEKLKEGYESEAYCSDTEIEGNKKTITMKTGPLRKNTIFHDDSSGEEKDEPMQLDTEHEKTDDKSVRKKTLSHKPQDKCSQKSILTNRKSADGPKRCFAMKSFERRVKALETSGTASEKTTKAQLARNTRRLFDGEETCYIIDARQEGNLGRFINHSCSPNLFVQNVFVDTHDLRFPWVAFFTSKRIKAGTELTWDYNYEVGSVEGKVLLCCCGSSRCTGRLL